ncbi:MAG: DMT(drug/metabolite transporter) superfamily permease [Acidimicrobiales bacterium]|nr:DMT(drug/metabolite transporter) superfamily permease [Acidimicrobiales bacterium]
MESTGLLATQRHGWAWCAGAAVLFGSATPAIKLLVGDVGSVTLAGLLYIGAALVAVPFARRDQRSTRSIGQRSRLLLAVSLGGGVAPILLVLALDRTPAGTVSLFLNLELVATALLARVLLQEHIGRRASFGIVVVVVGGLILAGASQGGVAVGAILVAATCVCWGVDNAITASLDSYSPAQITVAKGFVAGSVNLALGLVLDGFPRVDLIAAALAVGAVGYGISITMWITGARLVGAARGQTIFALAPFIGAVLAWPINGDRLTSTVIVAFMVSLVGVVIVGSAHHGHRHLHTAMIHAHAIDIGDPHHAPGAIEVLSGTEHRHRAITHEHAHLPDIHHRHSH